MMVAVSFGMKRIGVISDTHGYVDDRILHHLSGCDEIWHAGDIGSLEVTDALQKVATLRAVSGNIDDSRVKSEFGSELAFECEGKRVWMTHIVGKPGSYNQVVKAFLPVRRPDILVCGHSHALLIAYNKEYGLLHINPGAAGVKGFHTMRTLVRFTLSAEGPRDMEVVELGKRV
jgi:hypothetical protein